MKILFNKKTLQYNPQHIEGAYRIQKFPKFFKNTPSCPKKGLKYLKLLYSQKYIDEIHSSFLNYQTIAEVKTKPEYFDIACISIHLAVQASEIGGFAITRPPGHHASTKNAEGFCFFNNLAICIAKILKEEKNSKICIIDIDGHHGNGTQEIFKNNPQVLFCSLHQENTYPFSGFLTDKNCLNFPLPIGSSDDILKNTMLLFKKRIKTFKPNYIAISAGFDGYYKDALLNLNFSKRGFFEIGKIISEQKTKIFCCLEGGYHDEILECVNQLKNGLENKGYDANEDFTKSNYKVLKEYFKREKVFKKIHRIENFDNINVIC